MNTKAFTLVELMVVVTIIGILVSIMVPGYDYWKRQQFDVRAISDLRNAAAAQNSYYLNTNYYATCNDTNECASSLPGYKPSNGINVSFEGYQEYFTGSASHPNGTGQLFTFDSRTGGGG